MDALVAVIASDARLRSALAHAVLRGPGMSFAGAGVNFESGRALIDEQRPNVLVLDLSLPGGAELIHHAVQCCGCEVMGLLTSQNMEDILTFIKAGAVGFVPRELDGPGFIEQLRMLLDGGSPMPPMVTRQLIRFLAKPDPYSDARAAQRRSTVPLSAQERKMLNIASKGYVYSEVARLMGVSHETVLTYAKRIYRKLRVHTKTEAIYEARCLGWLFD
jgi:DNA-binding NarL/FixJ family response regulator